MYLTTGFSGMTTAFFFTRGTCITRRRIIGFTAEGDGDFEEDEIETEDMDPDGRISGRGAIGMADSTVLLYAGYPSHCRPDRTHLIPAAVSRHASIPTSEHTLWSRLIALDSSSSVPGQRTQSESGSYTHLQLLHPVLTFGLLALLCFFTASSFDFDSSMM